VGKAWGVRGYPHAFTADTYADQRRAIVFAAGITTRVSPTGCPLWDEYQGDVVYAIVFYLFLCAVWNRWTPAMRAFLT
jgi:hypothetical protein